MRASLVVLTKDNNEELKRTLSSVYSQLPDFDVGAAYALEVVVVDSSINSQSPGFFEHFENSNINLTYLRDFPPKGIYPGMNLGLGASTGDWVLFLNSGDVFFDDTSLSRLLQCCFDFRARNGFNPTAIFGQALICPLHGSSCKPWLVPDPAVHSIRRWLSIYYPNHQSLLVDGSWARAHPFQTDSPHSADRVWMRAALYDPRRVAYLPEPVVRFSLGGVSSGLPDWPTLMLRLREPTRRRHEKIFEVLKFLLRPWARHYPKLMALRSKLVGRLV
jgi:putative colanic acid biosynthesis glycosyltransferase